MAITSPLYISNKLRSKSVEIKLLMSMFDNYVQECRQANVSECADLHKYKIVNNTMAIKKILTSPAHVPFQFIHCLN